MSELTVSGLRVVHEIALSGSFTAAARLLGYSQSAISRQVGAIEARQALPVEVFGNEDLSPRNQLLALVGHLQKKQVGKLLDVILVREAVISQNIAVVPQFLNDRIRRHGLPGFPKVGSTQWT